MAPMVKIRENDEMDTPNFWVTGFKNKEVMLFTILNDTDIIIKLAAKTSHLRSLKFFNIDEPPNSVSWLGLGYWHQIM